MWDLPVIEWTEQERSNRFMSIWISIYEERRQIDQEELKDLTFFQLCQFLKEQRGQDTGTQSQEETWTQAWLEEQHQGRAVRWPSVSFPYRGLSEYSTLIGWKVCIKTVQCNFLLALPWDLAKNSFNVELLYYNSQQRGGV